MAGKTGAALPARMAVLLFFTSPSEALIGLGLWFGLDEAAGFLLD